MRKKNTVAKTQLTVAKMTNTVAKTRVTDSISGSKLVQNQQLMQELCIKRYISGRKHIWTFNVPFSLLKMTTG